MFAGNDKISLRQLQVLILLDIFGFAILTLPRRTAEVAGTDGWLTVLVGGLFMTLFTLVFTLLGRRHPQKTVVELSQELLTRPVGLVLSVGLAIKLMVIAGFGLRIFCEIVSQTLLPKTPVPVTAALMILVCSYAVALGYECRARTGEILFILAFLPFIFVLILTAFATDFDQIRPVFTLNSSGLLRGSLITIFAFQGIEFLFLVFPYLEKTDAIPKSIFRAVFCMAIAMAAVTFLTTATFGEFSVRNKLFPVLQMMDTVDFPGGFLERQDIIMLWFWVVSAFASVSATVFFATVIFQRVFGKSTLNRRWWLFLVMPVVFLAAILPSDIARTYEIMEWIQLYPGGFYILFLPLLLFVLDTIRRRRKA